MFGKRHHVSLTFKQKLKIIQQIKTKERTKQELCTAMKCNISTINRIIKNEKKIIEISKTKNNKRKRMRQGSNKLVEDALSIWFDQARQQGAMISRLILLTKAKEFATNLNCDFEPSSGWLSRWQNRENISFKKIQGESISANVDSANEFAENILCLEDDQVEGLIPVKDFQNFVKIDDDVQCYGMLSESEIINEVLEHENNSETEEVEAELEQDKKVDLKSALCGLEVLRKFLQQKNIDFEEIDKIEEKLLKEIVRDKKQRKITDFFHN